MRVCLLFGAEQCKPIYGHTQAWLIPHAAYTVTAF